MSITPLDGYVVVDLSSGIAGAYCTKLLADGGADVIKAGPVEDGALYAFLAASKRVVDTDDLGSLLERADAVIWSRSSPLSPVAIRELAPRTTVTSITPFGLQGPWSDRAATEFTLQAWSGGIIGLGRGSRDRPPVSIGGQIGEWLTGTYAAIGTMASLARGGAELVDLSVLEALVLCLTYYPVTYADMVGRPFRKGRAIVTPGVEATSDGLIGVGVGTGQQWLDFCVMVGHPEWQEDPKLFASRGHLAPEIAAWMSQHTSAEVLDLAAAFRIPHAPIGNGATIPHTDHFQARNSIVESPDGTYLHPGPPYRFETASPPDFWPTGAARPAPVGQKSDGGLPFDGLRVLDLTAFWAGPLCTHILGMLGAEVLHIESTARPDGTRLLAGIPFSEPDWWEQSGIFSGLNTNKRSVTLDLSDEPGRELLRRLIATCDVLVENYTPRVLEQIGLDIDTIRSIRPDMVIVRMPGFGLDGPWRDDPAFAFVIEDAAGLTWMTGHTDANPVSPYCVGDSNAGLHALSGLLLALEHRRRTGEGVLVEAAMVDAALNVAAEQIIEHSRNETLLTRDGNRGPTAAPQNLYLAADTDAKDRRDEWVAIAVATDEQWLALRDAIGSPWAMDEALTTASSRRERHDDIDKHLEAWCAERAADDIVDCLWSAGVPVARVTQPHNQGELPQLQSRGFFEDVHHPVTGTSRHGAMPMRFSNGPTRFHRDRAPLLGEHTEDVLRELGLSADEIAALETNGVIGHVPDAARG